MYEVGNRIQIINIDAFDDFDFEEYYKKEAVITAVAEDAFGEPCIYGTWGDFPLYPYHYDIVNVIEKHNDRFSLAALNS